MFDILGESFEANGDWNYRVYYEEYFEYLPSIFKNSAFGNYHVFQDNKVMKHIYPIPIYSKDKKQFDIFFQEFYFINSTHLTCMIPNYFCLETQAHEKFHEKSSGCVLEETINYQCPTVLYPLCKYEVYSQRSKVLNNLQEMFSLR